MYIKFFTNIFVQTYYFVKVSIKDKRILSKSYQIYVRINIDLLSRYIIIVPYLCEQQSIQESIDLLP